MGHLKYSSIENIKIECKGVEKLLKNINTDKASGPDNISNKQLAPVISHIFQLSLETGSLPTNWRNADISPICKKGDNTLRPTIALSH
jgi:hypothetical protein